MPTTPSDNNPEAYCSQNGLFYCNTPSVAQTLPNGWAGTCMAPSSSFSGITGYAGVTGNGGMSPVYSTLGEANQACTVARRNICVSVVRCTRQ